MANTLFDRTIAFASVCQSIKLVQDLARTGKCDNDALRTSLNSIIVTQPTSTIDIFEKEENLAVGLRTMVSVLDSSQTVNELTRYLINLLALDRKLSHRRDTLAQLGDRIETLQRQIEHFNLLDDQMISNLASVYLDTITPLGPRIQITGNPEQLQQSAIQNKIRALLLAGIRGAVLWRQVGGKRRQLIFSRKQLIEQAKIILALHS